MKILLLFLNVFGFHFAFSQKVDDFFLKLPESSKEFNVEKRKQMLADWNKNKKGLDYIAILDRVNGYLKWQILGGDMGGEMGVWKITDSEKRIVVVVNEATSTEFRQELPVFYMWDGRVLYKDKGITITEKDFYREKENKRLPVDEITYGITLPRKGKDIIIQLFYDDNINMKKKLEGDKIKLLWKNDHFEKSKPYF